MARNDVSSIVATTRHGSSFVVVFGAPRVHLPSRHGPESTTSHSNPPTSKQADLATMPVVVDSTQLTIVVTPPTPDVEHPADGDKPTETANEASAPSDGVAAEPLTMADLESSHMTQSGRLRVISSADVGPLFEKRLPSLRTTMFPFRYLGHWFSRRFNVFPKRWDDAVERSRNANASSNSSSRSDGGASTAQRQRSASDPKAQSTLVLDGLVYGESPRFRASENALYFSDMYGRQVVRVDLATGGRETVYEDENDFLSGLGWLPDGRMLIVSMNKRVVLVHDRETKKTSQYADVSAVTQARANDLVVAANGRVYLGNFGFLVEDIGASCTTTLVSVDPEDRGVRVEARGLMFPNGAVITPDGTTLIVAETFEGLLTAFTIRVEDGRLTNRRVWARVGVPIDGICLDAEGCVWASVPQVGLYETSGGLLRVREGGAVVNMLGFGRNGIRGGVFACQLATDARSGENRLYFLEAPSCKESDIFRCQEPTRHSALKSIPVRVGPALMAGCATYSGGYC